MAIQRGQPVARILPAECRDGHQDDPDRTKEQPAPLEDGRGGGIEDDRQCQGRPEPGQRGVPRGPEESEDLDGGKDGDDRDGGREDGAPEGQDDEQDRDEDGGADRPLAHASSPARQRPNRRWRRGVLEEGGVEGVGSELRPEQVGEVQLGVLGLPDQEVADALLAAGPDQEVERREADGVEACLDGVLVDLVGRETVRQAAPGGIDDLRAGRSS